MAFFVSISRLPELQFGFAYRCSDSPNSRFPVDILERQISKDGHFENEEKG